MLVAEATASTGATGECDSWRLACCGQALRENIEAQRFECPRCGREIPFKEVRQMAYRMMAQIGRLTDFLDCLQAEGAEDCDEQDKETQ